MSHSKIHYFGHILDRCLTEKGEVLNRKLYSHKSEVENCRFIHGSAGVRNVFYEWLNTLKEEHVASEDESNKLREQGNVVFKSKNCETIGQAALLYTKALYHAPAKSQALALAHANRAAALYKLGEYEEAYFDCECAISLGYPETGLKKILLRQATCARSLQNASKLRGCIEKLEKLKLNETFSEMDELRSDLVIMPNCSDQSDSAECDPPEKLQKIAHSCDRGRHVLADESIGPNEVIMSEKAAAFVPVFEEDIEDNKIPLVCQNCAENDIIPFPCYSCQCVSYCSPSCRDQHDPIHGIECKGYKLSIFRQIGISYLAFRVLIVTFENLMEDVLQKMPGVEKFNKSEDLWRSIRMTAKDGNLMGLCTNFRTMENSENFIRYALTASMLCCYLVMRSDFFERTEKRRKVLMDSDSEWEITVAALLLRLTSQMICNAHSISSVAVMVPFSGLSIKAGQLNELVYERTLFSAIYPRISLYNHSCEPNFRNKFEKTRLVVISNKSIGRGDEIFNCYGNYFKRDMVGVRQFVLKQQYGFICTCEHCDSENDFRQEYNKYKTVICRTSHCGEAFATTFMDKCPRCDTPYNDNIEFGLVDELCNINDSIKKYEYLYGKYEDENRYLSKYHESKSLKAFTILQHFLRSEDKIKNYEELHGKMIKIAIDLQEASEDRYGICEPNFVKCGTYLLDILALRAKSGLGKISLSYDLEKIHRSFNILPEKIRKKFEMYWESYIAN